MNVPAQFHIRDRVELATSDWPDHTTVAVIKSGTQAISGAGGLLPNYIIHNPYLLKNYLVFPVENNAILASQIEASLIINHDLFNSIRMKEKLDNACQQKLKWLPETRDVSLGGILINKETKEPVRDAKVFAAVLGQIPQLHSYTTEADGQFYFSLNHLNDFKDVCICTASKPEKIELLVYNDFSTTYAAINHIPLLVDSSLIELAKEMWVNKQTGKVFSEKNAIQLIHKDSLEFPFTNPHISKRLRDYIPMPTLFEVFNEIIPFVEVKKRKDHYSLSILSEDKKLSYNDPLVLVDNLPIFNMDELMEIHPAKIEQIDVYNADYTYGDLIIKGIVIIETNTEDFGGISPPENAVFIEYQTLSPNVEMSFPDYSGSMKQNRLPDFRNVLYWNPDATSNDTNSSLLFFAGDRRGDYEVIIKGHGKNGQLYYGKQAIDID